ncbi:MAG TPA: cytochrome c oxidase assembly protein [Anaerolineales bacterium]|nr:cytochrome c oxidase assembly protein [Anaerolineales bacterium]
MMKMIRYRIMGMILILLLLMFSTETASALDGEPPAPHDLWNTWNWDPILLLSLAVSAWIYVRGSREWKQRAGFRHSRAISFIMGLLTLFLALISPLDALSAALFSAHMLQHILLMVVAPPLLVLGVSPAPFLLAFDPPVQRKLSQSWRRIRWLKPAWHALAQLPVAWGLSTLMLWAWHVPSLYQAALQSEALHSLEHLGFMIPSLLFWWAIIHLHRSHGDLGILALFTMAFQGGLLGALLIFSPTPWYTVYAKTTQPWGLSPLEDQQLAGSIMWIPVGMIYTVAALILFVNRLTWIERTASQRERH